jgi:hypothetical protein
MVIDRLPPQLGPLVVSYGPETIRPNEDGTVHLVAGADYRLAISGVGGPTSVVLEASLLGSKVTAGASTRTFALAQNPDSGLWNGLLSFKSGGVYQVVAKSIDGAGNHTERTVLTTAVMSAGRVVDAHTQSPVAGVKVTLYYLEPTTRAWQVWDGAPYSQENPQTTGGDGKYSLMVPEGKYYLKVQGPLYHSFVSDIFTVDQPRAITATVSLDAMAHIGSVHLPDIVWRSHPIQLAGTNVRAVNTGLVGAILPDFNLPTTTGSTQRGLSLTGRPTLVTILTTWSPSSQNQLAALADLQTNKDINITPVFSQEHAQLVTTYLKTAGYHLTGVIDSDGVLVQPLHVSSAPQHILVDRTGTIRKVMNGVFTKDQLLNELGGL